MAASETAIVNLALGKLGQARIESMSDGSNEQVWASEYFSHARAFVTADALWRHAKKIAALSAETNDRPSDWGYKFTRPSDCLRLWHLLPQYGVYDPRYPIRFEAIGDAIYSDEPNARAVYVYLVTDTTKYTPSFDAALSWYLAHLLCQPLRMDSKLMGQMLEGYDLAKRHAIAMDAIEEVSYIPSAAEEAPEWMRARNG